MKSLYIVDEDTLELQTVLETEKDVKAIDFDPTSSNVYIGYPKKVVIVKNYVTSTVFLSDSNLDHMCGDSSAVIFTSRKNDSSSLLQYNITSEMFKTIADDLKFPGDILCDLNNGIVLISEKREEYSIRNISLFDNTTTRIKIRKYGSCRLATYPRDSVFCCSDINSNTIFDVTSEGKIGHFYSKSKHVIVDIDVDKQFLYGLLRGQRSILKISRNDATSTTVLEISPLYGQLSLISTQKSGWNSEKGNKEDNAQDNIAIILPTLLIVIIGGVVGAIAFLFIRRRKRQQLEMCPVQPAERSPQELSEMYNDNAPYHAIPYATFSTRNIKTSTKEVIPTLYRQDESSILARSETGFQRTTEFKTSFSYDYTTEEKGLLNVTRTVSIRAPVDDD
ncbi:uncharacterized protein LOC133203734 [Saccostrea echinata]|uniref:uncharacterized protein LOC133203734 n=1 Tax=Saccostrea echinata TaxID=191078 RepID=UPI002A800499|nr:uncharacterized protein LOC133203734 [Saccostrea echinata]